jgi:amino acid transporter
MLISVAVVSEVDWRLLGESEAPLTLVVSQSLGDNAIIFSIVALFATGNTVLILLVAGSRMLYGLSKGGSLPKFFSSINKNGTPGLSVAAVGIGSIVLALIFDIKTVAQLTDISVFIAYFAINLSLIKLASGNRKDYKPTFISPRLFGIPVFAYLGLISNIIMFLHFGLEVWLLAVVFVIIGLVIFLLGRRRKHPLKKTDPELLNPRPKEDTTKIKE